MSEKEAYVGIDLGTSSVKAMAFDTAGGVITASSRSLAVDRDSDGKAEQHPSDWEIAAGECLRDLSENLESTRFKPVAVAATGQMNGPVLLAGSGKPLRAVPLWCDTRCATQCERIKQRISQETLLNKTGHTSVTGYTAPKLMWIADNDPGILEAASHIIFPKDYINKLLTEEICTDLSDASNSLFLNISSGTWDAEIIDALGFHSLPLPTLSSGTDIVGYVSRNGAGWSGLPEGLPVAAGVGDSIAAALGAGVFGSSALQLVVGTSGDVNLVLDEQKIDTAGRIHTGFFVDQNHWIVSGVLQSTGASLQWWSDVMELDIDTLVEEIRLETPPNVIFAPYLAGERTPYLDPYVRGAFVSLSTSTNRADMTRAIIEGIAFSFKDAVDVFEHMGIKPSHLSLTGGGISSHVICRIITNIINLPLQRIQADITAKGAAILAANVTDRFSAWQDSANEWRSESDSFSPDGVVSYKETYRCFKSLYPYLSRLPDAGKTG
jgi:xylulokinase